MASERVLAQVRGADALVGGAVRSGGRVGDSVLRLGLAWLLRITLRVISMYLMTRIVVGTVAMLRHFH